MINREFGKEAEEGRIQLSEFGKYRRDAAGSIVEY